jgi:hypothetical protein
MSLERAGPQRKRKIARPYNCGLRDQQRKKRNESWRSLPFMADHGPSHQT